MSSRTLRAGSQPVHAGKPPTFLSLKVDAAMLRAKCHLLRDLPRDERARPTEPSLTAPRSPLSARAYPRRQGRPLTPPQLLLGPLRRYVGEREATVWVETDRHCKVEALGRSTETFEVEGHHYALVLIEGLTPATTYEYTVALDGGQVWPPPGATFPPSVIRTAGGAGPFTLAFGSCRVAAPHEGAYVSTRLREKAGRGLDAVRALAVDLLRQAPGTWPHVLLFLGDQVYADDVPPATARFIRRRRRRGKGPSYEEVADFEEYCHLYRESWSAPELRWLLSVLPTAMMFDDHDIRDDWNTSQAWRTKMWKQPWWGERIVGGLMAYWLYQHLGNLSPAALRADPMFKTLVSPGDNGPALRRFALQADQQPDSARWSFCRQWGATRLLMIDSRASRVVTPEARDMLDEEEWLWLEDNIRGEFDHLLLGTSLPFLLPPAIHDVEAWSESVCSGAWGRAARWLGERLRQAIDLEHWAAFQHSFGRLSGLVVNTARGTDGARPPATIIALSGDIHYAYVAEATPASGPEPETKIYQAVCSPLRNKTELRILAVTRFATSRFGQWLGRAAIRTTKVTPKLRWTVEDGPWFGNQVAILQIDGRSAHIRFARPAGHDERTSGLETAASLWLAGPPEGSAAGHAG